MGDFAHAFRAAVREAGARHEIPAATLEAVAGTALELLCRDLGTHCVYIPAPDKRARNAAIVAAWQEGQTLAQIAAEHGLTSNRIRQIIATVGAPDQ